jgi:23S rRNA pseudouridine1911/1915/1917 synthase
VLEAGAARERVDKVLARLLPATSRATVQRWISEGRVRVDGRACRSRDLVAGGQELEVEPGPRPLSGVEPDATVVFGVMFEDEHLLVVDKPAGLVVHPARGHRGGTLVHGLVARQGTIATADPRDPRGVERPGIVHRIDKDTSGILVVAKDDATREGLKAQLAAHRAERVYLGLTHGVPPNGTISTWYARHPRSRLRFTSRVAAGRRAITHVQVLRQLGGGRAALVECRLETGRTHQIRVHLTEQTRTPLVGDVLYRTAHVDLEVADVGRALGRQALHAAVLGFVHPVTLRPLRFESPLPEDFRTAQDALERLAPRV